METLYQLLVSPTEGIAKVLKWRPLGWAMLFLVCVAVVHALTFLPYPPELVQAILHLERGSASFVPVMFVWILIFVASLWVAAGIFHLVASLLRGRGSYLGILCGLSFATFPLVFFAPLALLRALLARVEMGAPGLILFQIGLLAILLWILILWIIAIRQNYGFSMGKAIATCFIPGMALVVIPMLVAAITVGLSE